MFALKLKIHLAIYSEVIAVLFSNSFLNIFKKIGGKYYLEFLI